MKRSIASPLLGALLALTGILVPSGALVSVLRGSAGITDPMLAGAALFRAGLVALGISILVVGRLAIWKRREGTDSGLPGRSGVAVLAALLAVATGLRLYGLGNGLWYDEIVTYTRFARMPFGEIVTDYASQNQHFLYTILAHAAFRLFGETAFTVRLPAALFGVGSIAALYLLGRQVTNVRETLLACAILTFSYHHVWFSQNARGYSGMLFWTVLSSWLLVRALREVRPSLWLLYAAAAALGVYTHLTMVFVVLGHFVIYAGTLVVRRARAWEGRWAGLFLGFAFAALLGFQLYSLVLPQLFGGTLYQGAEAGVDDWTNPLWTLIELVKGMDISFAGGVLPVVGLFVVLGAGIVGYWRTDRIIVQLLLLPAALGGFLTMAMGHPLWPRFFFFTAGFGALVVTRAMMVLGAAVARSIRCERAGLAIGTALCVTGIAASATTLRNAYLPKQDYSGAYAFVEEHRRPGDAVVTVGTASMPFERLFRVNWSEAEDLDELNAIRADADRTWVLYTIPLHLEAVVPDMMDVIRSDFRVEERFRGTLGDGTIFVCLEDRTARGEGG